VIRDFLEEDNYQATWILERLRRMGYSGSYDTLKVFVRSIKERNNRVAYTRFETEPGFQAQVDWGDFKITDERGKTSTVYAFIMVLGFSRAMYVEFVARCTLETFMDCHIRAFKALHGVPAEVLYRKRGPEKGTQKRGQIYFMTLPGRPCPRNSTRLFIFSSTSSTNLALPVNCPR